MNNTRYKMQLRRTNQDLTLQWWSFKNAASVSIKKKKEKSIITVAVIGYQKPILRLQLQTIQPIQSTYNSSPD